MNLDDMIKIRTELLNQRKDIDNSLIEIEYKMAEKTASKKIGDKFIDQNNKQLVVVGYKFVDYLQYCRLLVAKVKKNGQPYKESKEYFDF